MEKKFLLKRQKNYDLHYKMRSFQRKGGLRLYFLVIKMIIIGCYSPCFFRRKVKEKKRCSVQSSV